MDWLLELLRRLDAAHPAGWLMTTEMFQLRWARRAGHAQALAAVILGAGPPGLDRDERAKLRYLAGGE